MVIGVWALQLPLVGEVGEVFFALRSVGPFPASFLPRPLKE